MKIIISPAKQMQVDTEAFDCTKPQFLPQTREILTKLQGMNMPDLQKLWGCNDALAEQNYERIRRMDLEQNLTPAVLAYVGLQYTHMGPRVLEAEAWEYVCANLRILSGFYGLLRASDGVAPYRLEMQAKLAVAGKKNLYQYWDRRLYDALTCEDKVILNLASKEYSKAVEPYLGEDVRFVSCIFGCSDKKGGYKVKATEAKMARGSMVRWCAEHNVQRPEEVQAFATYGYAFNPALSSDTEYIFIK
ncbi:MAG: peroxide stress protein YaaA [Phascolarctobacterium sp.]